MENIRIPFCSDKLSLLSDCLFLQDIHHLFSPGCENVKNILHDLKTTDSAISNDWNDHFTSCCPNLELFRRVTL